MKDVKSQTHEGERGDETRQIENTHWRAKMKTLPGGEGGLWAEQVQKNKRSEPFVKMEFNKGDSLRCRMGNGNGVSGKGNSWLGITGEFKK